MTGIVVSLCDLTGTLVKPWAQAGYQCYCVDIQHSIRRDRVEFLAAFPPCTHLAISGAQDFQRKGLPMLSDALEVFQACLNAGRWSGAPFFIENPVGALSSHHTKPDFMFDPCDFGGYLEPPGDAYTKRTCLWTGNGFQMPQKLWVEPTEGSLMHRIAPGPERSNLRSATPEGFARAVFETNCPAYRMAVAA